MRNTPTLITDRIAPIVEPVHAAFERSRDRFNSIPGLTRDDQGWARTHFLRCFLWQDLNDQPLPAPWVLAGRHEQNGAINLSYGSGELTVKVVHAFPAGEVPPAGNNHARRAYYSNRALSEMADPTHMPTHRCLLTWSEDPTRTEPFELVLVRPLGTGSLRMRVTADVYLPLPRARTAFEELEFDTADADEMLEFDIDEAEGDVGTASDG